MNTPIAFLRTWLAEELICLAFKVLQPSQEKREMAAFIMHSWIGKVGG